MIGAYLVVAAAVLIGVAILALTALKGWQDWLSLKTRELDLIPREVEGNMSAGMARIELSNLKERIRKLEAIAAGVDL